MTNVEWTNEMIFKIIDLYQARRLLWDPNHRDYKDKSKKAAAWHEIGHALNLERETVQRKMKILTTQFQREYTKTSDPADDYSSKWFAYTRLLFMKSTQPPSAPQPQPHPAAVTSACVAPYSNVNIAEEQYDVEIKEEFDDDNISEEEVYLPSTPALYRKRAAPPAEHTAPREPPVKQPLIAARHTSSPATSVTGTTESRDEYAVFGEYIAMKLRKLSDAYSRHKAQQEIHNILFSAEMGEFSHPP